MPTSLVATGRFIGIYPLKQFAPVIHENHRIRAASRWAKTPAEHTCNLSVTHFTVIISGFPSRFRI
ncbi:MAG: hypothetical protein C4518_14990 [Desulfobacteraceae bacterium]|nr:MAG: hypothetical protein C4518_14990 [Desulfobacteraceae bacterium]